MRVAVVGAGVAGSACTWRLLTGRGGKLLSVTTFEMGRGAGGRAGTRRVRDMPDLHVNHGAPLFHLPVADVETKPLISALLAARQIEEWRGTSGKVDARTGALSPAEASRGEPAHDKDKFERYIGVSGMSSVASGSLRLAQEANADAFHAHFSTRIKEFKVQKQGDAITGWEIFDKEGKSFGVFDWIVMSGATPALARWRAGFHEEPPVYAAAHSSGSQLFRDLLAKLDRPLVYEQAHIVMLAWDITINSKGLETLQALQSLPYDITHVSGDESLAKIVRQSIGPKYAVVALHSTGSFARKHKKVMGSQSFVSVANKVDGSVEGESVVAQELVRSLDRVLLNVGGSQLPGPSWGPALHRWGAAFPEPDLGPAGADASWILPEDRFVFAGDYLAAPHACVATALRSGLAAGDNLLKVAKGRSVSAPVIHLSSAL